MFELFNSFFRNFPIFVLRQSDNEFWFFIFRAFNFQDNGTNFSVQVHSLSRNTTEKIFFKMSSLK